MRKGNRQPIMVWLLGPMGAYLSISFYLLAMFAISFLSVCPVTETYADGAGEALVPHSRAEGPWLEATR